MDHKNEDLQNEQGSMQEQTDKNKQHSEAQEKHSEKPGTIVPTSEVTGSDADQDRGGKPSIDDAEAKEKDDFGDDVHTKRSPWNSITFDTDDFFSGLVPA